MNPDSSRLRAAAAVGGATLLIALVAGAAAALALMLSEREPEAAPEGPPRDPLPQYGSLPHGYRIESIAGGLKAPTALDGGPDGRIFIAEQFTGAVRVVTPEDGLLPEPLYSVPDLYVQPDAGFVSELGLVGLTVEPDAGGELRLWLYYSAINDGRRSTKLARVVEGADGSLVQETMQEIEGEPKCCHIGGALSWLPDGTLLVGVGDHELAHLAQSPANLRGKLLRIDRDGAPAPGNPFAGEPDADPRVFAVGLRNPFGVAVDPLAPADAPGFVLDNGDIGDDTIYELRPGANYGWPLNERDPELVETPLQVYSESTGPAGAIVYRGPLDAFDGDLFFCQFHRLGALHWFRPGSDLIFDRDRILSSGCSSGIRVLPDGNIYFLDYMTGGLLRISAGAAWPQGG